MVEIQLSTEDGWDPVINRGCLKSSYQQRMVEIQSSTEDGGDPVIKRGGLRSSYQEREDG